MALKILNLDSQQQQFIYPIQSKKFKIISDQISVFTTEIIAIFLALQWIEVQPIRSVICTDSLSVLNSLLSGNATARQDMIFEVMQSLFRISQSGLIVNFMWVWKFMRRQTVWLNRL